MSIGPKFIELRADVFKIYFFQLLTRSCHGASMQHTAVQAVRVCLIVLALEFDKQ